MGILPTFRGSFRPAALLRVGDFSFMWIPWAAFAEIVSAQPHTSPIGTWRSLA